MIDALVTGLKFTAKLEIIQDAGRWICQSSAKRNGKNSYDLQVCSFTLYRNEIFGDSQFKECPSLEAKYLHTMKIWVRNSTCEKKPK